LGDGDSCSDERKLVRSREKKKNKPARPEDLLKLSEGVSGAQGFASTANDSGHRARLKDRAQLGVQTAVWSARNISAVRRRVLRSTERPGGLHGMLATVINSLALQDALEKEACLRGAGAPSK